MKLRDYRTNLGRAAIVDTVWDLPAHATLQQVNEYANHIADMRYDGVAISLAAVWDGTHGSPLALENGEGDQIYERVDRGGIRYTSAHLGLVEDMLTTFQAYDFKVCVVACWGSVMVRNNILHAGNARAYGEHIGRVIEHPAVDSIWMGGDYKDDQPYNSEAIWTEMWHGLDTSIDFTADVSYHGWAKVNYLDAWWLDYQSRSTGHDKFGDYSRVHSILDNARRTSAPLPFMQSEAGYLRINVPASWGNPNRRSITGPMYLNETQAAVDAGCAIITLGHNYRWSWGQYLDDFGGYGGNQPGWDTVRWSLTDPTERQIQMDAIEIIFETADDEPPGETINIDVITSGDTGQELWQLEAGDHVSQQFPTTTSPTVNVVGVPADNLTDIRIRFVNDGNDGSGDRNLTVHSIQLSPNKIINVPDPDVWATGVWVHPDGFQEGYGLGPTLHGNGWFDFSKAIERELGDPPPEEVDSVSSVTAGPNGVTLMYGDGQQVWFQWTT